MLMRTDPFRDFDRLIQQVAGTPSRPAVMPMDAYRNQDTFLVQFDLPGRRDRQDRSDRGEERADGARGASPPERRDGVEMVANERPQGTFSRQLFLGDTLDPDGIEAEYQAGVLTLRIPISERAKPRKVEISTRDEERISIDA